MAALQQRQLKHKHKQQHQEEKEEADVVFFGDFKSSELGSSNLMKPPPPPPLHLLLGPGFVEDVILWRRKEAAISTLVGVLSAWLVFQVWGYTLLSLLSNALLLLLSILFLWAKTAQLLNRPPPPVPEIQISEDAIKEAALYLQSFLNKLLSNFTNIALGNDTDLFYASASVLWFLSVIGSFTCFITAFYICLLVILTVPVLYEKYGECIDRCLSLAYTEVLMYERIYERFCFQCFRMVKESIQEIIQEDS